jgi:hypothetical protein
MNSVATKLAHESKDMDRAIGQIVDSFKGMQWLVVRDNVIIDAAYDMRTARSLAMFAHASVKNLHTGAIVAKF